MLSFVPSEYSLRESKKLWLKQKKKGVLFLLPNPFAFVLLALANPYLVASILFFFISLNLGFVFLYL